MIKYYIVDTTVSKNIQMYDSLQGVVKHLEETVKRRFNLSRTQYMQNLIDLGYGYDDPTGATFTTSMSEYFNIGVIRNGTPIRTNIHEAANHNKYREQTGD